MADELAQPVNQRLLEYDVGKLTTVTISDSEDNVHLLLYDSQFTSEFANATHLFIDGTYQTAPRVQGVYQLLAVLAIKYDHAIPIAHVLMSRKNECSYTAVFNSIKTAVINSQAITVVMTDFEQALRNACRNAFPHAVVAGCSVHYDRALLKKVKALHLTPIIRQEDVAKLLKKKIMALAYLPPSIIAEEYTVLKNTLPAPLQRSFAGFLRYFERQWLGRVKPTGFSVFRLSRRTNNVIESYNSVLKEKMGQHPSAWTFVGQLIKMTSNAREDLESLRLSKRIRRHPRYVSTFRQRQLTNAWSKLSAQEITAAEFLDITAELKGHVSQMIMRLPDANEDEAQLEEGRGLIAPDEDPDYEAIPRDIDEEAELALNHGNRLDAPPDVIQDLEDVPLNGLLPPPSPPIRLLEAPVENDNGGNRLDAPPEVIRGLEDVPLNGLLPPPSPPIRLLEAPVLNDNDPVPDDDGMPMQIDDEVGPAFNHEFDIVDLSSTEGETDDEHGGQFDIPVYSPQAPEEVPLPGTPPPPSPPINLPEAPVAGNNNASKSRKKNLRRKRRRQMKAQIVGAVTKPYGHKRRSKKRKQNTQGPTCVMCLQNPVTHGFVPCGHTCSCLRCATILGQNEIRKCPKCRAEFTQFIAIFNEPP